VPHSLGGSLRSAVGFDVVGFAQVGLLIYRGCGSLDAPPLAVGLDSGEMSGFSVGRFATASETPTYLSVDPPVKPEDDKKTPFRTSGGPPFGWVSLT
jgi:hypothetical protein